MFWSFALPQIPMYPIWIIFTLPSSYDSIEHFGTQKAYGYWMYLCARHATACKIYFGSEKCWESSEWQAEHMQICIMNICTHCARSCLHDAWTAGRFILSAEWKSTNQLWNGECFSYGIPCNTRNGNNNTRKPNAKHVCIRDTVPSSAEYCASLAKYCCTYRSLAMTSVWKLGYIWKRQVPTM